MSTKNNIFFRNEKICIYNESCLKSNLLLKNSVDLVVTSPPYNVGIDYNSNDDNANYTHYLEFTKKWLTNCYKWLKDDGRMCLNIPLDKNKNGQQSVYADILALAKKVGFGYHSTIIWNEGNISRRTAWGSWMSASAPYVIAPVETIIILYKKQWKKISKGQSGITRDEFMLWTNGLWTFNGESKKRIGHPAPFPRELPKRCIKLFSYLGDTILDPFLGSGTALLDCVSGNRMGIGIDIDIGYCELAKKRILNEADIFSEINLSTQQL
ncbi:MAG: site-specific DNA-methyltransferase [Burkholderiales bacterium]|nr:site-specific DNA-methyltransferase [Burkholderiales bacterium]